MMKFGYKLMTEEHGPKALVQNAVLAERAGFDFLSISDHFHPWLESQGHSPFAWSLLGAIAHATDHIAIATGLTCPILRYHPTIIAQAAATVAIMSDNRFTLAVGAGERLNEHVTGVRWPSVPERHEMLGEAIEIFRLLWQGGVHSWKGEHYVVDHAQLYDLPSQPIPIVVGVSGPASVAVAAERGDGIMVTSPEADLVSEYRARARNPGACYAEAVIAYASSVEKGLEIARDRFRFSAFNWSVNSEVPSVQGFEAASQYIQAKDLASKLSAGPDVGAHLDFVTKYLEAGFEHIVLTCPGDDQASFIDFFKRELKPALDKLGQPTTG